MTDRDLLLRAILDEPADDTARLVYADWLDELGGARSAARAEFIRVQVELSRTPEYLIAPGALVETRDGETKPWTGPPMIATGIAHKGRRNPAHAALKAREIALLKTWYLSWIPKSLRATLPSDVLHVTFDRDIPAGIGYVRFERGFVAHTGCELEPRPGDGGADEMAYSAQRFGKQVAALFAAHPLTGFTISFAGTSVTVTAAIGPEMTQYSREWVVGWDYETQKARFEVAIYPSRLWRREQTRSALGRAIPCWLVGAIARPAQVAARESLYADAESVVADDFEP